MRLIAREFICVHSRSFALILSASGLFIAVGLGLLAGCGTMANGRGWGQDATLTPGWERLGRAAKNAALAPETWAPTAGALAFQVGHADRNVTEWAAKNTPVFGSQQNAERMSDNLLHAAGDLWVVSGVAAPSGDEFDEWALNKLRGFGVQTGTTVLLRETVGYLKNATDRTRPNGNGRASLPSAHASNSSLYNTMTSKNIETLGWSDTAITVTQIGLGALTAATAWARVEANQHYPSDVLAGIALGHFFGAFFTDAFIGIDNPRNIMVLFEPSKEGVIATVRFAF
jgi:membrane-associated phospholipid phosphatase